MHKILSSSIEADLIQQAVTALSTAPNSPRAQRRVKETLALELVKQSMARGRSNSDAIKEVAEAIAKMYANANVNS